MHGVRTVYTRCMDGVSTVHASRRSATRGAEGAAGMVAAWLASVVVLVPSVGRSVGVAAREVRGRPSVLAPPVGLSVRIPVGIPPRAVTVHQAEGLAALLGLEAGGLEGRDLVQQCLELRRLLILRRER
eukprot:scaffold735_cov68-Phaeocystis_antarctica.AAC.2